MLLTNTLMRKASLVLAGVGVMLSSMAFVAGPSFAASTTHNISIPVSTIVRSAEGTITELASKSIEAKYQGMSCSVVASAVNQGSVHPGNDLIVKSGSSTVTLEDVERASNVATNANGDLTLSNKVTVSLLMGQDDVFSAGMDVNLTCEEDEIEVCRDGAIVTIPKSEKMVSDTDTCKEIEVCRNGVIVTIPENEKNYSDEYECKEVEVCRNYEWITVPENTVLDTDTYDNSECHNHVEVCRDGQWIEVDADEVLDTDTYKCEEPKEVQVCRDGAIITVLEDEVLDTDAYECEQPKEVTICRDNKIITVYEDEVLDTDYKDNCPEVKGEKSLPKTGAGTVITTMLGLSTATTGAYGYLKGRRSL